MDRQTFDSAVNDEARAFDAGNVGRFVGELAELCSLASVSTRRQKLPETADWVSARLESIGFRTEQLRAGGSPPAVWAEAGEGPKTLLFYNHYDVQPEEPLELWHSEPYTLTAREGKLFARGVSDNKGNLMARIHALETWQSTQGPLPVRVRFLVEGEEEIGSPHLRDIVSENAERLSADGCIWEGGGRDEADVPVLCCGAKGMLYIELRVRTLDHDLHSMYGGLAPNAAARLMNAIACLRDDGGRVLVDGMHELVRPLGSDETSELSRIPFSAEDMAEQWGASGVMRGLDGIEASEELFNGITANVAGIWSGYTGEGSKTIVPAEARAKMDFRLVPDLSAAEAERLVRAHLEKHGFGDIEIITLVAQDPGRTPVNHPLVQAARECWPELGEPDPRVYPNMAGTGPISLFTELLGLPAVDAGGVGWSGDRIHSPDESIRARDYFAAVRYWGRFLERFASME